MNVYTFIYLNVLSIKSLSHHLNHFKKVKPLSSREKRLFESQNSNQIIVTFDNNQENN